MLPLPVPISNGLLDSVRIGNWQHSPIGNILPRLRTCAQFPLALRPQVGRSPRDRRIGSGRAAAAEHKPVAAIRGSGTLAASPTHQLFNSRFQTTQRTDDNAIPLYPRSAPVNAAAFVKVVSIRSIRALMKSPLYPRVA